MASCSNCVPMRGPCFGQPAQHSMVGRRASAVAFGSDRPWEEVEVGGAVIRHDESVIGGEGDGLAVISALGDMMGEAGQDDAGDARHGGAS